MRPQHLCPANTTKACARLCTFFPSAATIFSIPPVAVPSTSLPAVLDGFIPIRRRRALATTLVIKGPPSMAMSFNNAEEKRRWWWGGGVVGGDAAARAPSKSVRSMSCKVTTCSYGSSQRPSLTRNKPCDSWVSLTYLLYVHLFAEGARHEGQR